MNAIKWYTSKFPETLYPCSEETQQDYNTKVITGRQKMAESTVVICGIARDIAKNIMVHIYCLSKSYKFPLNYLSFLILQQVKRLKEITSNHQKSILKHLNLTY